MLVLAGIVAVYLWAQRRHPADNRRRLAFDLGLILLLAVYLTPVETIALHYLLAIHLLQNVVTAEWAPGLMVFGIAPALAQELMTRFRLVRALTHPFVALPVWLGTYFFWHVPAIYDTALTHQGSLLHIEHATYFAAGLLMWWPVAHGRPVYDFYKDAPQLWGLSDLTDQQIAGVTMAVEQAIIFFAVFAYFFSRFLRTEQIAGVFSGSSR